MRIRCPSCSATYEVADALLEPPRTVRCARCAHDWIATAATDADSAEEAPGHAPIPPESDADEIAFHEPEAAAATEHGSPEQAGHPDSAAALARLSAIERLAAGGSPSPGTRAPNRLLIAAWAASFAVLAGLGAAAYVKRDQMMRLWPASIRMYAKLGLGPDPSKGPSPPGPAGQPVH